MDTFLVRKCQKLLDDFYYVKEFRRLEFGHDLGGRGEGGVDGQDEPLPGRFFVSCYLSADVFDIGDLGTKKNENYEAEMKPTREFRRGLDCRGTQGTKRGQAEGGREEREEISPLFSLCALTFMSGLVGISTKRTVVA